MLLYDRGLTNHGGVTYTATVSWRAHLPCCGITVGSLIMLLYYCGLTYNATTSWWAHLPCYCIMVCLITILMYNNGHNWLTYYATVLLWVHLPCCRIMMESFTTLLYHGGLLSNATASLYLGLLTYHATVLQQDYLYCSCIMAGLTYAKIQFFYATKVWAIFYLLKKNGKSPTISGH